MKTGEYYVLEGQDGTGKSTYAEDLGKLFQTRGKKVVIFHEPDGDLPSAQKLREIIKDKQYDLDARTHVLLFTAARNELWRKLAVPCLDEGGIVISARNWWSTLAYQGYGQGVNQDLIAHITKGCLPDSYLYPTKSVILTLDDDERIKRLGHRDNNSSKDTFESKDSEFQKKVTNAYWQIASDYGIPTIDAAGSIEEVFQKILTLFSIPS